MDAGQGFASGLVEGQEAQQKLAMGGVKLKEEDVALQQAEMMLENQKKFANHMAQLNSGSGQGPGQDSGGMAERLASRLFAVSDAALKSNLPEQAADLLHKAEAIQKGHLELESAAFQRRLEGATLTSNLIKDLDPKDPKATDEFHSRMVAFGGIMGKAAPPDLMKAPFTQELKERLMSGAETVKEEASRKLEEQRLKQSQVETQLAEKRKPLIEAQTRAASSLATAREKAGANPKVKVAEQRQIDNLTDVSHDIDEMIRQLEAAPGDETLTGFTGTLHSLVESARTRTGIGDQSTPTHDFETTMKVLQAKLPRAMTGVARSSKDEREVTNTLSDLRKPGVSSKIALKRLKDLNRTVKAQITRSGIKPTEEKSVDEGKTTDDGIAVTNWE
jgi:hypothetical protein